MNTRSRRVAKRIPSIFDDDVEDDTEEDVFVSPSKKRRVSSSVSSDGDEPVKEGGPLNLSDSSDSEDEASQTQTQKDSSSVSNINSSVCNGSDDSNDSSPVPQAELYDFSEIIKTQDFIKQCQTLAPSDESKAPYEFKPTEEPFEFKETPKPAKGRKKSKSSTKTMTRQKNVSKVPEGKDPDLDVSELLAIGETGQSKSDDEEEIDDPGEGPSGTAPTPVKNIEIKIDLPGGVMKKRNRRKEMEEALKRQLRAVRRENQVFYHKVSLLCCIAHGNFINSILLDEDILGRALSIIPSENFYPPKLASIEYLEKLTKWFNKKVQVTAKESKISLFDSLKEEFAEKVAASFKNKVLMFVCIVRVLGLPCRLIINLTPMPLRPPTDDPLLDAKARKSKKKNDDSEVSSDEDLTVVSLDGTSKSPAKKSEHFAAQKMPKCTGKKSNKSAKDPEYEPEKTTKKKAPKKGAETTKKNNVTPENPKKKITDRRVLSSDEKEELAKKEKEKINYWAEIYLESEEKWICVDPIRAKVHCASVLCASASHPVAYVLAWNEENRIKDVTKRYTAQRAATVKKYHVDNDWWLETLRPWRPRRDAREKAEDADLERVLADQPLPVSIADYKNHPLYALRRHLLKFEAIYPDDAPPLGFVKKEPVYSRMLVVQLHSRETWFREAKVVKIGEKPYKIVKARPKWDKLSGQRLEDKPLELYGHWQVVDYIPPIATDGKVPKNEYGNVEIYKPSMIPIGTVHLQVPGLMRIAKKLNIDCAPALIGWEYSGGGSHPIMDGFIVCEEYRDKVLDLWAREVDDTAKKEKQKNKQRIYDNWKRLIKGLIIRERLEKRYNFQSSDIDSKKSKFKNAKPHAKRKDK